MNRRGSLALLLLGTFCLEASGRRAVADQIERSPPTPVYFGNGYAACASCISEVTQLMS